MYFTRRRGKSLREEVLSSKKRERPMKAERNRIELELPDVDQVTLNVRTSAPSSSLKHISSSKSASKHTNADTTKERIVPTRRDSVLSYVSSSSVKGSFLRNKLENPLFKTSRFFRNRRRLASGSALKHVRNASESVGDSEQFLDSAEPEDSDVGNSSSNFDEEDFSDDEAYSDDDFDSRQEDSSGTQTTPESRTKRIINLAKMPKFKSPSSYSIKSRIKSPKPSKKSRKNKLKKSSKEALKRSDSKSVRPTGRIPRSRYLLSRVNEKYNNTISLRSKKNAKTKSMLNEKKKQARMMKNSSISSSNSNSSDSSHLSRNSSSNVSNATDSEIDVDLLTRLEEQSNDIKTNEDKFILFTEQGRRVEVFFSHDYLQVGDQICFYEDLASWTNDSKCLRMIYVKNKDSADQERVEMKLYVVDKNYQGKVTPADLNELLRKKIALLMCSKLGCSIKDAEEATQREATEKEVKRVVDRIDASSERCIADAYKREV